MIAVQIETQKKCWTTLASPLVDGISEGADIGVSKRVEAQKWTTWRKHHGAYQIKDKETWHDLMVYRLTPVA